MKTKQAQIIITFLGNRRPSFGSPTTPEDVLKCLKHQVHLYTTINPGCDLDLIIVNHYPEETYKPGEEYLSKINGSKCEWGEIKVIRKPNEKGPGHAHSFTLEKYSNQYDYFLLNEDDVFYTRPNYFSLILDEFKSQPNTGFLALAPAKTFDIKNRANVNYQIVNGVPQSGISISGIVGVISNQAVNQILKNDLMYNPSDKVNKTYGGAADGEVEFFKPFTTLQIEVNHPNINNILPIALNYGKNPAQGTWTRNVLEKKGVEIDSKKILYKIYDFT